MKNEHPNRIPFEGVLTRLDEPSDGAPSGSRGHCVLLTTKAAEAALPTLIGMAVGYKVNYDGHDFRQKCGVITEAWINESELHVRGHIYGLDFPDVVRSMGKQEEPLGMSYELADAHIADMRAKLWTITRATFTGAAILRRDKAAYRSTRINLSAEIERFTGKLRVEGAGHVRLLRKCARSKRA